MDVINKLYSSVSNSVSQLSNVLPGNPLAREYEIESQVCSAGIGEFLPKKKPDYFSLIICIHRFAMASVQRREEVNEAGSSDL